jgi:predicted AlkP superfamily pyrophosphatase or phosphodiesterase
VNREEQLFWSNEAFYSLPAYLPGRDSLDRHLRDLDARDGTVDGTWRGNDLSDPLLIPGTPAFVAYQEEALLELLRREGVGGGERTDLLYLNLKPLDTAGHLWNMERPEVRDVLEEQDRVLGVLAATLDERVGEENYVLGITADHGQTPFPEVNGGVRIDRYRVRDRVHEYFGTELLQAVHPDDVYVHGAADGRKS